MIINVVHSVSRHLYSHPRRTLAYLFGLCLVVYLITIPLPRTDGMLIGSDGVGYYAYVRSMVLDHDLDFSNEYSRLYPTTGITTSRTPTGLVPNQFAIGPGLLWAPFFIVAHLVALLLHAGGLPVVADGYNYLYQAAICIGSMIYGFLGILLIFQTVRRFYPRTALAVALLIWLATNVIYYMIVEPSMSHMCSLFAVALLVFVWVRSRNTFSMRECFAIGLVGGLVGIVRQPDATLLVLPLLDCLLSQGEMRLKLKRMAVILMGFILVFWVQMAAWQILNGNPFSSGYFLDSTQGFSWLTPHLIEVFFSTEHGLFIWHPILLLALAGFIPFSQLDRRFTLLLVSGILMQGYIIASWSSWSQADAFGGRMFIASLPLFAIGLGASLQWALERWTASATWLIGLSLILWNGLFLIQYRFGFISMGGPYTLYDLIVGKFTMLFEIGKKVVQVIAN